MTPSDLTAEQRQLIVNMADLWVRQHGIQAAGGALVIVSLMQQAPETGKGPKPGDEGSAKGE